VRRRRGKFLIGPCEFQAASMADLAFLLLVFFIVTTVFAVEEGIPLVLPGRSTAATRLKQRDVVEIRAYHDGRVDMDGATIAVSSVRPLVESRIAANPDVVVVLLTAPDAEYGLMVEILDQIKLARCRRISLQAME
jgi:biopolymer transport protein ExbD